MKRQAKYFKDISIFNGIDRKSLAVAIGSSRNTIDQLASGVLDVSPWRALEIERATDGKIPAAVLRPDIFGPKTRKKTKVA